MDPPNTPNRSAHQPKTRNASDLAKEASALLRSAGFDAASGAKQNKQYHRSKRAEQKIAARRWRERTKKLGKLGAASPVRQIEPAMREDT